VCSDDSLALTLDLCLSHSSRYFEQICSNQLLLYCRFTADISFLSLFRADMQQPTAALLPLYCRSTADISFLSLFRADMQQPTPAGRLRCIQFFRGRVSMPLLPLCRLLHSLSLTLSLCLTRSLRSLAPCLSPFLS
jgi:hypothetical protein